MAVEQIWFTGRKFGPLPETLLFLATTLYMCTAVIMI